MTTMKTMTNMSYDHDHDYHDANDHDYHDDHYHNDQLLHKQVGGYLIPYHLQLACVRKWRLSDQMRAHCCVDRSELEYHESLTQSLTRVGEELSVRAAKNGLSQL